jgi:hypothetical protein
MSLKDFEENMFLPQKEIFINKIVRIREVDAHLISITLKEHRTVLWAMYKLPCCVDESKDKEKRREYTSNRDRIVNNSNKKNNFPEINISEIIIQKQKMTFSHNTSIRMSDWKCERDKEFEYFREKGIIKTNLDEVDFENTIIVEYEQKDSEEFPTIDFSKNLDIILKLRSCSDEVSINQSISMKFSEMGKGNKFYFYDSIEMKRHIFYIDKMYHNDVWAEVNNILEYELMRVFPKDQIEQMKEEYITCLEKICPKGMDLAMLEYETEDNVQLNFYSKEYLDERPVHNSSATIVFFKSDRELGSNGFKSRVCMIKPVEKDFDGIIDIELLSCFMKRPEEIIIV